MHETCDRVLRTLVIAGEARVAYLWSARVKAPA